MARKRKKLQGLGYESTEYWNRLLAQEGMTLDQGLDPRLVYGGGGTDMETLDASRRVGGRKLPHKPHE